MTALLQIDSVGHNFGGLRVLENVSLSLERGAFVGLIGPNGSGKTTLFNIVSGFLRPARGTVRLAGQEIRELSVERRSAAGLVRTFQTPQVFDNMTVLENVMSGCHKLTHGGFVSSLLRLPSRQADLDVMRREAKSTCARFGFGNDLDCPAAVLPAGRRRLLELARACVARPSILLLDEPSSGLSTSEVQTLVRWLKDIHSTGMTLLLVSHHMELMEAADHVHVLDFGRIIGEGTLEQVKAMPHVQRAYLGAAVAGEVASHDDQASVVRDEAC